MNALAFPTNWPIDKCHGDNPYHHKKVIEEYRDGGDVCLTNFGQVILLGGQTCLGLNRHPAVNSASIEAIQRYGSGTCGVRPLAGTLRLHQKLEQAIATFTQSGAALTFTSGYLANMSTVAALVGTQDTVICHDSSHASLIDGCKLSQANVLRFRQQDMNQLEQCLQRCPDSGKTLLAIDAVDKVDGDIANLPAIRVLCERYNALLLVNESHSFGVLGDAGRGLAEHWGLPPESIDIRTSTLSKAIPCTGGFVAASRSLCDFLSHRARGFLHCSALSPPVAAAALASLQLLNNEPEHVARLHYNIRHFATQLDAAGIPHSMNSTAIFTITCGEDWRTWQLVKRCQDAGVCVQAIVHPVVAAGTARLRAVVSAAHSVRDLEYCAATLRMAAEEVGVIS